MTPRRPPIDAELLYTATDLGRLFGVQAATVTKWAREGRIPAGAIVTTPGGRRRYRATAIDILRRGGGA